METRTVKGKGFSVIFSPNNYSSAEKKIIEENVDRYLVSGQKDFWFSLGKGLYIIPYEEFLIVYKVMQSSRNIFLLNNTIDEVFNYENVIEALDFNLQTAPKITTSNSKYTPDTQYDYKKRNTSSNLFLGDSLGLMLSLTSDCNLMCSYCYINGGKERSYMTWDLAKNSIDFAVERCIQNQIRNFDLSFHGQGEPTLNWSILSKSVEYFIRKYRKHFFNTKISLTTNGLINRSKISFLKKHNISTTISMDCSSELLNELRPLKNGGNLLPILTKTLETFDSVDHDFCIRSTVSSLNVSEMCDFIAFLSQFKKCRVVHFEPVDLKGRANSIKLNYDFYDNFIDNFDKARILAHKHDMEVVYSGSQLYKRNSTFCNAIGRNLNFCVSTDGVVSSCYEHLSDDLNNPFIYGKYADNKFMFYEQKYLKLLNKYPLAKDCKDCFLAYTCSGDCHSQCFSNLKKNEMRCYINREIAKRDLLVLSLYGLAKEE